MLLQHIESVIWMMSKPGGRSGLLSEHGHYEINEKNLLGIAKSWVAMLIATF